MRISEGRQRRRRRNVREDGSRERESEGEEFEEGDFGELQVYNIRDFDIMCTYACVEVMTTPYFI